MKKLIALASALLVLTGCAAQEQLPAADQLPAVKNYIASAAPVEPEAVVTYADVIRDSYQLFLESGMTEEVTSGGDRYVLTYEPGEEFLAALFITLSLTMWWEQSKKSSSPSTPLGQCFQRRTR